MKATRTEQHVIKPNNPIWKMVDENCFYSKNLYNFANYVIRQELINNDRWIRYREIAKMLKTSDPYVELKSQPAQQTLAMLEAVWKSFFVAIKDWKQNPSKYLGRPRLPKYLPKDGRYVWSIKNNISYIKNGVLHFQAKRLHGVTFKTSAKGRLQCVRFVPKGTCYVMEIVTEVEVPDIPERESKRIASIDLGIDNLATITNNIGLQPIIINGKGVKSINQHFNKQKAEIQSELKKCNDKHMSRKLQQISFKRSNKIKNYFHNASRYIVNYCISNDIDTLICGKNEGWKQETNLGKATNQKFVSIPFEILINQLAYKCQDAGIKFILTEESYTSGTSFLDDEFPCKENYNKARRIKRGLFQSSNALINSDVNGSYQILRKVFPDSFRYGIRVQFTPVVVNAARVA